MDNYTALPNENPGEGEFINVNDVAIKNVSRVIDASFTTEQIYTLVNLLLGVAFERERTGEGGVL